MEPSSGSPGRAGGVRKTYYIRKHILTIYNDDKMMMEVTKIYC